MFLRTIILPNVAIFMRRTFKCVSVKYILIFTRVSIYPRSGLILIKSNFRRLSKRGTLIR